MQTDNLTEDDIGEWVEYEYPYDVDEPDKGRIKGWNEEFVYVVFNCAGNWDEFKNYTGVACPPHRVNFTEKEG